MTKLLTDRLILRNWQETDYEPFAVMNADPRVMEFFPSLRSRAESDETAKRLQAHIDRHGFGFWALERRDNDRFIGFTGIVNVDFEAAFTPAVEIGWRLPVDQWGQGFASEAARCSLAVAFNDLGLEEVVSYAVVQNKRSRGVMERLGMHRDPAFDFDHPLVPQDWSMKRFAFYRIGAADYRDEKGG